MNVRRYKHWGWGFEDEALTFEQLNAASAGLREHLGFKLGEPEMPVSLEQLKLPPSRIEIPIELREISNGDVHARATHALGKSYTDVVRGFRGQFDHPPDFVLEPQDESQLERILQWCSDRAVAVIPFGGGTSVVGGVQAEVPSNYEGVVSVDMRAMNRVLEVEPISRSARIQAGATGPALERQLSEHGLTLRHFPQSFEFSTLGGWIATRAAGHFVTGPTHIEDLVESVRAITPVGDWQSRRLPGSGAGPSPDRMLVGSEGTLGVITEAWMQVRPRPLHRASTGVRFGDFMQGAECVRAISQADLHPSNCRLIDSNEARMTFAGDGTFALLVLGFESSSSPVSEQMNHALKLCAEHGGEIKQADEKPDAGGGEVGSWRQAFLQAPYLRDTLVAMGVLAETFESAITWERFPVFHERICAAARQAMSESSPNGEVGQISCRFTHVYPDGPAVYFTVIAPASRGEEAEQWAHIKNAVSNVISEQKATITHHHAVGRDHRKWYDQQRPDLFASALRAAKSALDPQWIMNPGVLVDRL